MSNGVTLAPTGFEDIYYEYKEFRRTEGLNYDAGDKKLIKGLMISAQKQTKYGLDIGQQKKGFKKNGTHRQPYFNFVIND